MAGAVVGERCNIGDHAFVESNVVIGDGVTIKNGVSVWDGVSLANNVFVGPNAVFTNDLNPRAAVKKSREQFVATIVEEGASIGANATIVCGTRIGRFAFIGAGAVIIRDVPDYAMMVGNPARQIGFMCECGERLAEPPECKCGLRFDKAGTNCAELSRPPRCEHVQARVAQSATSVALKFGNCSRLSG